MPEGIDILADARVAAVPGASADPIAGALARLMDELALGVVLLESDGARRAANTAAQQLVDGPAGPELERRLAAMCTRATESGGVVEATVSLGVGGEVRLLLVRAAAGPEFVGFLEHGGLTRLRTEIALLRRLLAVATDALHPREAAERVLASLAAVLPGCALVLYEREHDRLACAAHANVPRSMASLREDRPAGSVGSVQHALNTRAPVVANPLVRSPFPPDRALAGADTLGSIALPVRCRGTAAGVLLVVGPSGGLGAGELRLLHGLADAVGVLLQRARQDEAMEHERQSTRALVDNLPDAVLELTADGLVASAGGRLVPILGRAAEDLVGRPFADLLQPDDRTRFRELSVRARPRSCASGEFELALPDGRKVDCEIGVHAGESGAPAGLLRALVRDVTLRKAAEAALQRAARAAARSERLAVVGRLAAGIAHEINNPATFVKLNVQAVQDEIARAGATLRCGADADADARLGDFLKSAGEALADALTGIDHIIAIVRSMRGVARQRPDERVEFDPAAAARDALALFRGSHRNACVDDELGSLPRVRGAPGALGQVLLNLLENGLDATGGTGRLHLRGEAGPGRVRLCVRDHGPGIPPHVAQHLFEPFFTTKDPGKGTGLGLAISRDIVREMGGTLSYETGPDGTVFAVELAPADEPVPIENAPA